jgi:hypothetical protein
MPTPTHRGNFGRLLRTFWYQMYSRPVYVPLSYLLLSLLLWFYALCWVNPKTFFMKRSFVKSLSLQSRFFSLSRPMSFSESHKDYSLHGLEQYAKQLISVNLDQEESSRTSVCIVVAGGRGHAISTPCRSSWKEASHITASPIVPTWAFLQILPI